MGTNQQDVRVRLSAEGMAEVVSAFQRISAEGKKSAKETGNAFAELNKQFADVGKTLLGGLGLAFAADKLKDLFSQALDTAESLTRLSAQTGLSTDAIQAFGQAARETGSNTQTANQALERLTASVGRAEIGSKQSQVALRDLGLSAKEIADLPADQRLQLIAQRLGAIPDPARRARDEMALLGRGGTELDQALVKLGREGISGFVARLQELGTYLDKDTIAQLLAAKDNLQDVSDVVRGLGTQFLVGLLPALTQVTGELAKATGAGEGFRAIGAAIGEVIRYVATGFQGLGIDIANFAADAVTLWEGFADSLSKIAHGKIRDALQSIKEAWREAGVIDKQAEEDKARAEAAYEAGPPKPAAAPATATGAGAGAGLPPGPDDAYIKARYQLITTMLDNELKLYDAKQKLELDQEKAAYDRGQVSLQDYFAKRAAIINTGFDKQIAIAKAKLAAEEAQPLPAGVSDAAALEQRRAEAEKLRGQIADINAQRQVALQDELNTLHQQEQSQADAAIRTSEQLLTIEGKRVQAAKERAAAEAAAYAKELLAGGATPDQAAGAVGQFAAQNAAALDFTGAQKKASSDLLQLETQKKEIQDQVTNGKLFSLTAAQKELDIDRQMLPTLQADADAMLKFAQAAKDPQLVASAEAFKEKIDQVAASTNTAGKEMAQMRAGVEQAIGQGLNTLLDDAILKSKSLGQAFDAAAKQILADLVKMALQIEEQQFLKALFGGGLFGGGGGSGAGLTSDLGLGGGASLAAAAGGYVRGPGSTTSDSIPVLLSDKEFVVNAQATGRPGILGFLHALNEGVGPPRFRVPQLAAGGSVSSSIGSTSFVGASGKIGQPIQLHVAPEALHLTLRDWFEGEIARINSTR